MKKIKTTKKVITLLLAVIMMLSLAACSGSSSTSDASGEEVSDENSDTSSEEPAEEVEYSIYGNYTYANEEGENLDEEGASWFLFIDSETKFHLVGIKYDDSLPQSVRIDEGQVTNASGYTLSCAFTPYQMFTQYINHGTIDDSITETVVEQQGEVISEYIDSTGDEFFQITLNRTSNDDMNAGTFTVEGDITLGWGVWQEE